MLTLILMYWLQVTVCQTCGDRGIEDALLFCDKCQNYALHRYNLFPLCFRIFVFSVPGKRCENTVIYASHYPKRNAQFLVIKVWVQSLELLLKLKLD